MTVREVYDALLNETNKVEAPSLLLQSFNYYLNKSVNECGNQWYTFFEKDQLLTDNLRVLTKPAILTKADISTGNYYKLPVDYWHLLPSVIVNFTYTDVCTNSGAILQKAAIKLDSQMQSGILRDYYTKPSYKRPYILLHQYTHTIDPVPTPPASPTEVYEIEIKCGDTSVYSPDTIQIDYLKKPTVYELTNEQLESDTDESQTLEFPDNSCYEIIKKLTALVLEQTGDIRLQNNLPLNQTMTLQRQV